MYITNRIGENMLSVQRVNLMSNPAFGKRDNNRFDDAEVISEMPRYYSNNSLLADENEYNMAKAEWEGVRDNIEGLEDLVPEPMKKPYKWLKIASSAVVTGLGVVWASKKAGNVTKNALTSDFAKKVVNLTMSSFDTIKKPFVTVYKKGSEFAGKKLAGTKAEEFLNKTKDKALNNKVVDEITKKYTKAESIIKSKAAGVTFEKVNNVTAGILGTGSGLAAGYEAAIRGDAE